MTQSDKQIQTGCEEVYYYISCEPGRIFRINTVGSSQCEAEEIYEKTDWQDM